MDFVGSVKNWKNFHSLEVLRGNQSAQLIFSLSIDAIRKALLKYLLISDMHLDFCSTPH